jgi:glycerol transport system ATP-binding protein
LQRRPNTLSGGQQQRVALARALIKGADLVILDEPLANLDYKLREDLRAELPGLFAEMGAVLVYATTEPTEALVLGGNTACMFEGKVEQFGPTLELYRQPAGLQTARIFSDPPLNTLRLHYRQGELRIPESEQLIKLRAELNDGQDYTLGVRPHHLCLVRRSPEDIELRGEVTVTEIGGSESFVHFEFQNRAWVALIHGIVKFASSEAVSFFVQPRHSLLFDQSDSLISNSTAMIMAP